MLMSRPGWFIEETFVSDGRNYHRGVPGVLRHRSQKVEQRVVAPSSPPYQSPEAGPSNSTSDTVHVVDNTFYVHTFHPALDLQFHEPPSHEALKHLKLSALPVAPKSLSQPPKQFRKGHEYIYQAHSDANPYFIWPPLLSWPCFNCTLTGTANEYVFEGNVVTLLDPLILSGDGAIAQGLTQVDTINTQLESLGKVVNSLRTDREGVISEPADGLDSIALGEHGSKIIDAYVAVSDFLKSFIICPGSGSSGDADSNNVGGSGDAADI
ncbi:hypothetical protein IW261DRAFT_1426879 [Armillaria novae-zelandiae]|uniref:Uncharacterized protein n=1 Tax=Armillaria novae-zelandiae TaxID=153914 RepID=A0AA39NJ37_9AGAR|nr:hypothetical protein IW261DRAFT_1426879 [Armillaria novae-zelandiae]